jgi:predicted HAD superfamily Cof-like phosphohydrolase
MSENWVEDIHQMHSKFGVHEWMKQKLEEGDTELLRKYLQFRLNMLDEELLETRKAVVAENWEEVVDGLIDLCVFAVGTLDAFDVNGNEAWNEVFEANMAKEPGVKPGRPNPWGMPDMMKPGGWQAPTHKRNIGRLEDL